jgi:DNA-binding LytR/AlgR family response regulator
MHTLFVKLDGKYKAVTIGDIHYLEAFKNYVRIHTGKKVLTVHCTLKQIEEHLSKHSFCKVHKSYIISVDKITEFDHESVTVNDIQLPMTSQFGAELKTKLTIVLHHKKSRPNVDVDESPISTN